jgi:hypothetical protein
VSQAYRNTERAYALPGEWPRHRSAIKKNDELAPSHCRAPEASDRGKMPVIRSSRAAKLASFDLHAGL